MRNGIILVSVGVGLVVGLLCSEYLLFGQVDDIWIVGASVIFFLGFGYLLYFLIMQNITRKQPDQDNDEE